MALILEETLEPITQPPYRAEQVVTLRQWANNTGSQTVTATLGFYINGKLNEQGYENPKTRDFNPGNEFVDFQFTRPEGIYECCVDIIGNGNGNGGIPGYGAAANNTGSPIGGGLYYKDIKTYGNITVSAQTRTALQNALNSARSGDIVYIPPNFVIPINGSITIPAGVTLASNRGYGTSQGARLTNNSVGSSSGAGDGTYYTIAGLGPGVRVTGLRLSGIGPTTAGAMGVELRGQRSEVDNCEIYNFGYCGVRPWFPAGSVGYSSTTPATWIHHNYIYHCRRDGTGYGVLAGYHEGNHLIEANRFNYCRHHVSGHSGTATNNYRQSGFEARFNIFMPYTGKYGDTVEFHSPGGNPGTGGFLPGVLGGTMDVHHNDFYNTIEYGPIGSGGQDNVRYNHVPYRTGHVYRNLFQYCDWRCVYVLFNDSNDDENIEVEDNYYCVNYSNSPPTGTYAPTSSGMTRWYSTSYDFPSHAHTGKMNLQGYR
jgi:hypothetical protein